MQKIHLFKPGRHSPSKGDALTFSGDDLSEIAASYDPELHEAPIVVGHPGADAPAYGWVAGVSADADGLWAEPHQVEPEFAELVRNGRFKKISIALYRPDNPRNPKPGAWYLRHVGFLGAQPPAVKGLKPVEFAADDDAVTLEFGESWQMGWLLSDIAGLFRGVRDWMVGSAGAEQADKLLPGGTIQRIAEEAARIQERATVEAAPAPRFSEEPKEPDVNEAELARQREELDERERNLAARETEIAERAAAARRADDAAFVEGLVKQARLPGSLAPRATAILSAVVPETEVTFGEGEAAVKQGAHAALRELLAGLPPAVTFGEKAATAEAPPLDDQHAIAAAATEFQEKEVAAGRSVSWVQAVEAVTRNRSTAA